MIRISLKYFLLAENNLKRIGESFDTPMLFFSIGLKVSPEKFPRVLVKDFFCDFCAQRFFTGGIQCSHFIDAVKFYRHFGAVKIRSQSDDVFRAQLEQMLYMVDYVRSTSVFRITFTQKVNQIIDSDEPFAMYDFLNVFVGEISGSVAYGSAIGVACKERFLMDF